MHDDDDFEDTTDPDQRTNMGLQIVEFDDSEESFIRAMEASAKASLSMLNHLVLHGQDEKVQSQSAQFLLEKYAELKGYVKRQAQVGGVGSGGVNIFLGAEGRDSLSRLAAESRQIRVAEEVEIKREPPTESDA